MGKSNEKKRKSVYLIVADKSEEFSVALRYAARTAVLNDAHVGVLYVMQKHEFMHWGDVETRMRQEIRQEAEQILWTHARRIHEINGQTAGFYMDHGNANDVLIDTIDNNDEICKLILAGGQGKSPGPIISYLTTKGLSRLRVPLTVVPGHLQADEIDNIF